MLERPLAHPLRTGLSSLLAVILTAATLASPAMSAAENVVVRDIEPTKELPRHSEGSFATLASGRIIFYYTQFYGALPMKALPASWAFTPTTTGAPGASP